MSDTSGDSTARADTPPSASQPTELSPPLTPGQRLRQALRSGGKSSITIFIVALVASSFLWLQFGAQDAAIQIGKRVALVGALVFISASLSRWILIGKFGVAPKLSTGKARSSDWAGFGFLLGLAIAGYVTVERNIGNVSVVPGETLEISGPTLDGGQFDLAQFRGKVVLIDFWATWCGPCVAELPRVQQVYDRFHDQGLEIVSVSFDQSAKDLKNFVQAKSIPWPQIIYEDERYQGFNNPNGVRYQVNGIPEMMLADREGRLIARGMRGAEIGIEVGRALGVPTTWSEWLWALPLKIVNWFVAAVMGARWYLLAACTLGLGLVGTIMQCLLMRPTR